MTKFRKRIGEKGVEKIFKISLMVNAKEITEKELKQVMIDSTVQEKNITFPTDAKLYRKIIERVLKVSEREHIELRQTYTREVKALKLKVRFMNHPTRMKKDKKYEFGNKSAIAKTGSGLIVSALAFQGNPYDGHTLSAHREQIARLAGYEPVEVLTEKARKKFCKRAGIEPVIGHLKSDHRMMRNYLKGTLGDAINTMMAAAAYNMRHWMNKHALSSFVSWLLTLVRRLENVLFENENQYAWKDSTLATVAK